MKTQNTQKIQGPNTGTCDAWKARTEPTIFWSQVNRFTFAPLHLLTMRVQGCRVPDEPPISTTPLSRVFFFKECNIKVEKQIKQTNDSKILKSKTMFKKKQGIFFHIKTQNYTKMTKIQRQKTGTCDAWAGKAGIEPAIFWSQVNRFISPLFNNESSGMSDPGQAPSSYNTLSRSL